MLSFYVDIHEINGLSESKKKAIVLDIKRIFLNSETWKDVLLAYEYVLDDNIVERYLTVNILEGYCSGIRPIVLVEGELSDEKKLQLKAEISEPFDRLMEQYFPRSFLYYGTILRQKI